MRPTQNTIELERLTIAEALQEAGQFLRAAGIPSAQIDARVLLAHALGVEREFLAMHRDAILSFEAIERYDEVLARRVAREPVARIIGKREFWSLPFVVTKDTLDPRPDSETVVEAVLRHLPPAEAAKKNSPLMIADFGTGTGCLLLSLLTEYQTAYGLGVDFSNAALKIAAKNAAALKLTKRMQLHQANWGEGIFGRYDIIVSNPPYIPRSEIELLEPEVVLYEPLLALTGGEDGLNAYRTLFPHVARLLAKDGIAVIEFGMGQALYVVEIARLSGLQVIETVKDLAGIERCVVLTHPSTTY